MRTPRLALALALALTGATGLAASAADAPRTTATSSTFFLRQEGCGTTAEAGRLEPKAGTDTATGCGTIGGVPLNEVAGTPEPFTTTGKGLPIKLDAAKKVTGQLAAASWIGFGVGAGAVDFDVALTATTVDGKTVDFGSTTVSTTHTPPDELALVPFEFAVPASGKGATLGKVVLTVLQRGANVGMSAAQFDGDSWVAFPTRP